MEIDLSLVTTNDLNDYCKKSEVDEKTQNILNFLNTMGLSVSNGMLCQTYIKEV